MARTVQYLKIAGRLYPDNRLQLRHSYIVPDRPTRIARVSEVSAEVQDADGTALGRWPLTMRPYSDAMTTFAIRGSVPLAESAVRVELWRDSGGHQIRLAVLDLPDSTPEVTLTEAPTRAAEGRIALEWEARGDPEPVEYRLHYSADDGESWIPVSQRLTTTRYELDLDHLPGGRRCRIRVRATNGVRSSDAVSGAFRVALKPCIAIIQQPIDGAELDSEISVLGNGWYLEEREPELRALRWESDRDGPLGSGTGVLISLSPGEHTITLTAGTEKRAGSGSVHITVRERTDADGSTP